MGIEGFFKAGIDCTPWLLLLDTRGLGDRVVLCLNFKLAGSHSATRKTFNCQQPQTFISENHQVTNVIDHSCEFLPGAKR